MNPNKPNRFANPKPLDLETRILQGVVPGGVTVGEVDAAIREYWGRNSSGASLNIASFYLVSGITTDGYEFELSLDFNAGTPADSEPDSMACQTNSFDGPFEFSIERNGQGYVRRFKLANGVEIEDQTADTAFSLLPEIITGAFWMKRGPFRLKDAEEKLALPQP